MANSEYDDVDMAAQRRMSNDGGSLVSKPREKVAQVVIHFGSAKFLES